MHSPTLSVRAHSVVTGGDGGSMGGDGGAVTAAAVAGDDFMW